MLGKCNICGSSDIINIYKFKDKCITSMCSEKEQGSNIYFCKNCAHVQTDPIENIHAYYADSYNIGMGSEEEDQLLKIIDGEKIYRYTYQAEILIKKLDLAENNSIKILDFGAAKSSTLRKVYEQFPHITPFVFDVSENYKGFWDKFIPQENQFLHRIPDHFKDYFDVICSFFMLEHVENPLGILQKKYSLLKPGGMVYFVVPNLYKNSSDFLVIDHINHFSFESMSYMMENVGFENIVIDDQINDGWFVVTGVKNFEEGSEKTAKKPTPLEKINSNFEAVKDISTYWERVLGQVNRFSIDDKFSIYGAGFYGSYLAVHLPQHLKPSYFIDQNKFLQGKEIHGMKIIAPEDMPEDIKHVVVGINPLHAETAIRSVEVWKDKDINFTYLLK